jgi:hypothetical protein
VNSHLSEGFLALLHGINTDESPGNASKSKNVNQSMLSGTEVQLQLVNDSCSGLILDGIEELQSAHGDVKERIGRWDS